MLLSIMSIAGIVGRGSLALAPGRTVHLMPFACMPETTASGILDRVSRDLGLPVLTLILDEQENEGRIITLLEAFVDMLRWRSQGFH